jgi:hypothetical protein
MGWFKDKYGEDAQPILPIELCCKLMDLFHDDESVNDIIERVQEGRLSVDQVRKELNRPDIDPEDWQAFEDGWRPDGWND